MVTNALNALEFQRFACHLRCHLRCHLSTRKVTFLASKVTLKPKTVLLLRPKRAQNHQKCHHRCHLSNRHFHPDFGLW